MLREAWINLLRTEPEENHIKGRYKCDNGFCAVGLLLDEYLKSHDREWGPKWGISYVFPGHINAFQSPKNHLTEIAHMNDVEGKTFAEIADYVEATI